MQTWQLYVRDCTLYRIKKELQSLFSGTKKCEFLLAISKITESFHFKLLGDDEDAETEEFIPSGIIKCLQN